MFLELALDLVRDDGAEERDALDECGEDQCRGLNATGSLGLARHSLGSASTDTADADARADDGEASAQTGADEPSPRLLLAASAATWSKEYMVMEFSEPLKIEPLTAPRR